MPLTDDLVAFWELEEASGTRVDAHGPHDLSQNGGTIGQGTGKVGNCADLTAASSQYLSVAHHADLTAGAGVSFTVTAWVNAEALGASRGIACKNAPSTGEWYLRYFHGVPEFHLVVFQAASHSGGSAVVSAVTPATATWFFIAAWHDASANQLGMRVNATTATPVSYSSDVFSDNTAPFLIGENAFGQYWDGLVDQVGFWRRALSGAELDELYNSGSGLSYAAMAGSDTVSWLPVTQVATGPTSFYVAAGMTPPDKV
jgi:hypothetical protein